MGGRLIAFAAALAWLGFMPEAFASLVNVTYSGTITNVTDTHNLFNNAVDGQSYSASYIFDTSVGTTNYRSPGQNYTYGNSPNSPNLYASITINGSTVSFIGDNFGELYGQNDLFGAEQYHYAVSSTGDALLNYSEILNPTSSDIPSSIDQPFHYGIEAQNSNGGAYSDQFTSISLIPSVIDETFVAAVPIPPTLPLFAAALMGLGGFGYLSRRPKRIVGSNVPTA